MQPFLEWHGFRPTRSGNLGPENIWFCLHRGQRMPWPCYSGVRGDLRTLLSSFLLETCVSSVLHQIELSGLNGRCLLLLTLILQQGIPSDPHS